MRATLQEVEPRTEAEQELYAEGLDQIQRLGDARRMRLVQAGEGIPGVLWAVLVLGAGDSRFYPPLWLAEHPGAQTDGDIADGSDRASTIHNRCHGASLLRRSPRRPGAFELILERFETSKLS